jgi:hypothetical protein
MGIWQLINYWNAKDVTAISYETFHKEEKDVYPSIGLCFANSLIDEKLNQYAIKVQPGSNAHMYTMRELYSFFLAGEYWNPDMLQIDYDDVTKNIDDYVLSYEIVTTKFETIEIYNKETQANTHKSQIQPKEIGKRKQGNVIPHFRKFSLFTTMKCVSVDIPFKKGMKFIEARIRFNNSIFNDGVRPTQSVDIICGDFFAFVPHYPKQFISKLLQGKRNWPVRNINKAKNYITELGMRDIEILQRRNKYKQPCVEDMIDDDDQILQWIAKLVGCKPPYWNSSLQLTSCVSQEQFKKAFRFQTLMMDDVESINLTHKLSCRRLEKIQFDVQDFEVEDNTSGPETIEFKFAFREF